MKNSKLKEDISPPRRPGFSTQIQQNMQHGPAGKIASSSPEQLAQGSRNAQILGNAAKAIIPGVDAASHMHQGNYGKAALSGAIDAAATYGGLKLASSSASTIGKAIEPYVSPIIGKAVQAAGGLLVSKPVSAAGYAGKQEVDKIQETSHETVNHVRRLAMKHKRNDR